MLDGVVICGGEPTINRDLPQFLEKIKKMGFLIKLDTNGSNPSMIEDLINKDLIDYAAMDIKAPLNEEKSGDKNKYERATGVKIDLDKIKKSIDILKQGRVDFEFRTTVVPLFHSKKDILEIAQWIKGKNVKYYLQNFRPEKTVDANFQKTKPYSEEYLKEIVEEISPFFKVCAVRG